MTKKIALFAAYDEQAIWGVGYTAEEAIADAKQHVSDEDAETWELDTAEMSQRLAREVERCGGNIAFDVRNGRLMTREAGDRIYEREQRDREHKRCLAFSEGARRTLDAVLRGDLALNAESLRNSFWNACYAGGDVEKYRPLLSKKGSSNSPKLQS